MKLLLCITLVVAVASASVSVAFSGTVRTYILAKFNNLRSRMAKGIEPWGHLGTQAPGSPTPRKYYPRSKRTYKLVWSDALATAAKKRLDSLANGAMTGTVAATVGEISVGIDSWVDNNFDVTPRPTPKSIFDIAWENDWYGFVQDTGLPSIAYKKSQTENINMAYQFMAGNVQKIGCVYRNESAHYAVLCQMTPKGLAANVAIYPPGAVCSACPNATAPCNKAAGLCVSK